MSDAHAQPPQDQNVPRYGDDAQQFDQEQEQYPYFGPPQEEVLLEWTAPSRPFKKRNKKYFTTIFTIVLLISLILFFAGQIPVVAVVIAVGFVAYVLATIPPTDILYQFTTYGVRLDSQLFYWEELGRFWIETTLNTRVIHIEVARFPGRLTLVINESEEQQLYAFISQLLLEQKPEPNYYEKMALWLQKHIPLDLEA